MMNSSERIICFVHIGRTAGTTIHHLLMNNSLSYLHLDSWFCFLNERGNYLSQARAQSLLKVLPFTWGFGGHFIRPFLDDELVLKRKPFYFTFMRDPIRRYLSGYNFLRLRKRQNISFTDFLNKRGQDNITTKRIAGACDLQLAKEVIRKKIGFVGLVEKFDESLLLLRNELKIPGFKVNYQKKNIISPVEGALLLSELSEADLTLVKKNNELDMELYKYVSEEIYPDYLRRCPGKIEEELYRFRISNENYSYPWYRVIISKLYSWGIQYPVENLIMYYEYRAKSDRKAKRAGGHGFSRGRRRFFWRGRWRVFWW